MDWLAAGPAFLNDSAALVLMHCTLVWGTCHAQLRYSAVANVKLMVCAGLLVRLVC